MAFPTSPSDGQTTVINNTSYTYNAAQGTWTCLLYTSDAADE